MYKDIEKGNKVGSKAIPDREKDIGLAQETLTYIIIVVLNFDCFEDTNVEGVDGYLHSKGHGMEKNVRPNENLALKNTGRS